METLAVFDNVADIVEKLKAFAPDIVFNLSESFHHDRSHEPNIPALLELMKVRYTGAGPDALLLCKDKALAKKVLAYHHVRLPHFVVSHRLSPAAPAAAIHVTRRSSSPSARNRRTASARRRLSATEARPSSARDSFTRNSSATR